MTSFVQLLLLCSSIAIALTLRLENLEDNIRNEADSLITLRGGGGGGGGGGGAKTTAEAKSPVDTSTKNLPSLTNILLSGSTSVDGDSEIRDKRTPNYYGGYGNGFGGGYGHHHHRHHHHGYGNGYGGFYG